MDQDIKGLLEKNLKLSEDNNKLLLKLHNIQKWTLISRVLYWLILIGIAIGAFYFIQPLISNLTGIYGVDSSSIMEMLK